MIYNGEMEKIKTLEMKGKYWTNLCSSDTQAYQLTSVNSNKNWIYVDV